MSFWRVIENGFGLKLSGPPDLVVEILSPGTAARDLGLKLEQYEIAGIPEYWIVDPESEGERKVRPFRAVWTK